MRLNIEHPFNSYFDRAYLVKSQGRNTVCLYNSKTQVRKSISYARYLMSVKLGRFLNADEHVDHINNLKNDDRIDNLQILSQKENNKKYCENFIRKMWVKYKCPVCNSIFNRERCKSHLVIKTKKSMTCSRKCGGMISHSQTTNRIIVLGEYKD